MTAVKTGTRRAFLFGLRSDGSPTCHPMVALEKDGAPVFNTYRKSVKAQNFMREPRAVALLLDDWQTSPSKALVVSGLMEEIDPMVPSRPEAVAPDKGGTDSVPESVAGRVQKRVAEGKRMLFRLRTKD